MHANLTLINDLNKRGDAHDGFLIPGFEDERGALYRSRTQPRLIISTTITRQLVARRSTVPEGHGSACSTCKVLGFRAVRKAVLTGRRD